ncbi:hypothetical protein [Streptomyces candidus]|uniref:Uncharacterized protein n=1 Tax=Streptomyces candidus TaxID=67283 RepID=A0A7X0HLW4_9ACTN|nr:hypothetical protein [Streptomyces candidus]MBB6439863.1 hypothetical protein [Streptomyces candidus]GHH55871.1 hypothetical protein GCM10018773_60890 [Streptomyces candidus]
MPFDPLLQALSRVAATLLDDLAQGAWYPSAAEKALSEALARTGWNGGGVRTELRAAEAGVHDGRLVDLLSPAAPLGELTAPSPETEAVLRQLTRLLDAVAGCTRP